MQVADFSPPLDLMDIADFVDSLPDPISCYSDGPSRHCEHFSPFNAPFAILLCCFYSSGSFRVSSSTSVTHNTRR